LATAPVPPPPPSSRPSLELTTLRLLAQKGLITRGEYDAALNDLNESTGGHAANASTLTLGRWKTTVYGFAQADMMWHSTQSFNDFSGNIQVARPGTLAGDHGRFTGTVRDTRFGFRAQAPQLQYLRATGVIEFDFLGNAGTIPASSSEAA